MTMSAAAMLGSDGALTVGSDTRMTPDGSTEGAGAPPGQEAPFAGELRRVLDRGAREAKGANEGRARVLPNHAATRAGRSPFEAATSEAEADVMVAEQRVGARQGFMVKGGDGIRADNLEDTLDDARREGSPVETERPVAAAITLPSPPPRPGAGVEEREADSTFPDGIAVPKGMSFVDEHTAPSGAAPLHGGTRGIGEIELDSAEGERTIDETERAEDEGKNTNSADELVPFFAGAVPPRIEIAAPQASSAGNASASGPRGVNGGVASAEAPRQGLGDGVSTLRGRQPVGDVFPTLRARAGELRGQARTSSEAHVDEWSDEDLRVEPIVGQGGGAREGEGMSSRIAAALSRSLDEGRDRGRTRLDEAATATATGWLGDSGVGAATGRLGDSGAATATATGRLGDSGAATARGIGASLNTSPRRGAAMASFGAAAPVEQAISFQESVESQEDPRVQAPPGHRSFGAKGQSPDTAPQEAKGASAAGPGAASSEVAGWDARQGAARRRGTLSVDGELPPGIRWTSARPLGDSGARSPGDPSGRAPSDSAARVSGDFAARGPGDSTSRASGDFAARGPGEFVGRVTGDSPPRASGEFNARVPADARGMTQRSFTAVRDVSAQVERRPFLDKDARAVALNTRWGEAPGQAVSARGAAAGGRSPDAAAAAGGRSPDAARMAPDRSVDRASGEFGFASGAEALRARAVAAGGRGLDAQATSGQAASRETGTFAIPRAAAPGAAPADKALSSSAEGPRAASLPLSPPRPDGAAPARFSAPRADGVTSPRVAPPRPDGAAKVRRSDGVDAPRAFEPPPPSPRAGSPAESLPGDASLPRSGARTTGPKGAIAGNGIPSVDMNRSRTSPLGAPALDPRAATASGQRSDVAHAASASGHRPDAAHTGAPSPSPERAPGSASSTGTFSARGLPASGAGSSADAPRAATASARSSLDLGWAPPLPGSGDTSPALSPDVGRESPTAAFQAARAALAQAPIQADGRLRSTAMNDSPSALRVARRATSADPIASARRATSADPLSLARIARGAGRDLASAPFAYEPRDAAVDSIPATPISAASGWHPDTKRDPLAAQRAASHHPETGTQDPPSDIAAVGLTAGGPLERDDSPAGATATLGAAGAPQGNTFHLPSAPIGATNANSILAMNPAPAQGNTATAHLEERLGERRQRVAAGVRGTSLPRETRAEADIPELGRIAVLASPRGAEVDVRVTAQRTEAARVLQEAAPSLESHLRHNAVPLGHLSVGDHATGQSGHHNAQSDPRSPPAPRDQEEPLGNPKSASPFVSRSRVRVVL